ncbi:MAG TPA: cation:proton antiporter [Candidatus Eisenbacteria bacterium]|nr:cation:proton antiporter [Candidatus Eisenbacteria bacterium]
MEELTFLRDLAVVMAVSAATTVVFHVLRQPVVLGYIVAGVIIGPHTPPFSFVTDFHTIHTLAELGVILLLFSLGLEFDLRKLQRVGGVAVLAAVLEILLMIWLGYSVGRLLGWSEMDSLFLGALLSISSTTIIVQVLMETGQLREPFAQIILGILIVEDIAAIIILVILSGLATAGTITALDVGWALLNVTLFMIAALVAGYLAIPRLIAFVSGFGRSEMLTVTVLGLAFGLAALGAQLGFSVALGAFLMGAIVAESPQAHEVVERIGPIREMFTAVFFVATGMLLDPKLLLDIWGVVLFLTVITVVGKIASCSFGTFLAGYPGAVAIPVGLGMAQIGEFSFIIANLGRSAGVTSPILYPITVAVSSLTTFFTPYLLRSAQPLAGVLTRLSPRPLVTFATFYTAWLSRLTDRASGSRAVRGEILRLLLYLAATVAVFVVVWKVSRPVAERLPPLMPRQIELLPWTIAAVAALPLLFLIGRTLESLTRDVTASLTRRITPDARSQTGLVRNSVRFLFGWIAAIFLLAAGTPVLPPLVPLAVVILGLLATTLFFWEALVQFHRQVESLFKTMGMPPEEKGRPPAAPQQGRDQITQLLGEHYGPEVQTEDFVVPVQPTAVNQTIRNLALRASTGASIIAIYRGSDPALIPQLDTVILPGDVLLLLGGKQELEAALRYLGELCRQKTPGPASPPEAATAVIGASSPASGRTLGEIGLRELGVLVVGVRRGEDQVTNPGPDYRIEPGDVLHLWGPRERIAAARARLEPA